LKPGDDEKYSPYISPKGGRNRSQSSSAIFGIPAISVSDSPPGNYNDLNKIWSTNGASQVEPLRDSSSIHRRSSTQPNQMWESDVLNPEEMEAYETRLRFTHAPSSLYNDAYAQHLLSKPSGAGTHDEYPGIDMRRRHSVAGPLYAPGSSTRYLTETLENMNLNDVNEVSPTFEDINDYFENTEHRTKAWVEAGKNLQMQSFSQTWPLCVVEFKAGRHDFFYVADSSVVVKKGDLCIVEADRGKDLGKVIHDNIQNIQQLQLYQANHIDLLAESQFGKDVHPKRIYRLALPNEISLLVSKSHDEAKAVSISQSKIRQKKLPMEVVDAEYQWDRRKLTLYFVADRRIDFRELVRDLFKLYKTRIWMCAVNPLKQLPHQPQPM
jgi:cell fate regulator YaaT (PSP1 superfamily)